MTFELSAEHEAVQHNARAFAIERVGSFAQEIDRRAAISLDLARDVVELVGGCADPLSVVITVEELAAVSGAVALTAAAGPNAHAADASLAGLRGALLPDDSSCTQLALAAVALGLGRSALDAALSALRHAMANPVEGAEKPHWVVADVATELEAARLITRAAALATQTEKRQTAIAIARLMASGAAQSAVDAALRITGPTGYRQDALLERLSRDVRTVSLLMGTEEQHRAVAAEGFLP